MLNNTCHLAHSLSLAGGEHQSLLMRQDPHMPVDLPIFSSILRVPFDTDVYYTYAVGETVTLECSAMLYVHVWHWGPTEIIIGLYMQPGFLQAKHQMMASPLCWRASQGR